MNLSELIPNGREILFACIGTDRSTGDCVGPLTGTWLEEKGYTVIGTLDNPLHAVNLGERMSLAKQMYPQHFIVAIDACLGKLESIGNIIIEDGPLFPGKAVKKDLPAVGDISIKAIVNIGGYQEYTVLQNTRLNVSWKLAQEITRLCEMTMKQLVSN